MIKDDLQAFFQAAQQSPEVSQKLTNAQSQDGFVQVVVDEGKKLGYDFSVDAVAEAIAQTASGPIELSEDQLDAVAGGGWATCGGSMDWTNGLDTASACCVGGQKKEIKGFSFGADIQQIDRP